jgi:hypothetical protein
MHRAWLALLASALSVASAQDSTHPPGWVVIPVTEYGALRDRAFPIEEKTKPPAVDSTLTRVDYDLQIDGSLATGQAKLTVDVLKDGWVRVPIPAGLLVHEAKLDGKPLSLVSEKGGLYAVFSRPLLTGGRAVLELNVALPAATTGGEERLTLPTSPSGITRASVTLPREDLDIKVAGGILSENSGTGGLSRWLAYGRSNGSLTFSWRRKIEDHHVELPLKLRGSMTELVSLGEDSTSIYAEAGLEIAQGAARQARIQLAPNIIVNQVSGAMVADWEIKSGELVVKFLEPVEKDVRFVIVGEARLPREGAVDVPLLRLLDTERESGGVAVEVVGAGEIKDVKAQGLERADPGELGQTVLSRQSPAMVAFRFRTMPAPGTVPTLAVQVARYAQQAVLTANIEEARYRVLLTTDGKMLVQARYAVRNNQRNFVRIRLPDGAVVWSSSLAGTPVRAGQAEDGSLLFPLTKSRAGEEAQAFAIEILYLVRGAAWSDKGRASLDLPALDLPISRTGAVVHYPPLFHVSAEAGAFRMQAFENPSSPALSGDASGQAEVRPASPDQSAASQAATQSLVDQYKARIETRRGATRVPIGVEFLAVGPSLFLVSELTAESHNPTIQLAFQKSRKGGVK